MKKGICFLDFDGVINNRIIKYENGKFNITYLSKDSLSFSNKQAILWISKLCIENNLDIVIISSHINTCDFNYLKNKLYNSGLVDKVVIKDTIKPYIRRDIGIREYLSKYGIDKYVIIDDENYYEKYNELNKHLILCSSEYGFLINEYISACNILEKNNVKTLK